MLLPGVRLPPSVRLALVATPLRLMPLAVTLTLRLALE